jgi:hypothetical protein
VVGAERRTDRDAVLLLCKALRSGIRSRRVEMDSSRAVSSSGVAVSVACCCRFAY